MHTLVVIGRASKKNPMQMTNRKASSFFFVLIRSESFSESELRTHSAKLNTEPKPIVIIMRKKRTHQS